MANNIEREIVQMVFDAKEFRKGVRNSIEDLEELKGSFELSDARQSFGELEKASRLDFGGLAKSLESINGKMSIMGVAAAALVTRVTNAVVDSAKRLANVLVLDPIRTGLEEYETQLNAVQTILANTAKDGTTLENVSDALDELNEYADLTIYNFTQMTDSIGKFTTAGVDLDTSVSAIKGIANVAAVSGSNAQQASTAMYQLSQAISSGIVRLQDWISVENAGMGGQVFRDALLETARVHDVAVDQMIEKSGSFRNSLAENWLTSDILLETLDKFTGDLTDAQLESLGYSEEQIKAIQEVAATANDAATKIKTLTQLKDTMAEALQSGWGQTWRIVFGDFEEAKQLWGNVATIFGDIIANSANARNSMLELWASVGGRVAIIDGFMNILEGIINILGAFGEAIRDIFEPLTYVDLTNMSLAFYLFSQRFKEASTSLEPFKSIVRGVAAGIDILRLAFSAVLKPILEFLTQYTGVAGNLVDSAASIGDSVVAFREFAIETDFFNNIVEIVIERIGEFIDRVKELVKTFTDLEVVQDISNWLASIGRDDLIGWWNALLNVITAIATPLVALALLLGQVYKEVVKLDVVENFVDAIEGISWAGIKEGFSSIKESISGIIDSVRESDLLEKFITYLQTFDGRRISQFFEDAKESFSGISDILSNVTDLLFGVGEAGEKAAGSTEGLGSQIYAALNDALDFLIGKASNIDYSAMFDRLFQILNTGVLLAIAGGIRSLASGGWLENALQSIGFGEPEKIGNSISRMFGSVEGVMTSFQNNIKADTLQKIAVAIALLTGSIILITLIDSKKLLEATAAIAGMIALLFGSAGALKLIKPSDAATASVAIISLSVSILILAAALKKMDGLDADSIETSMLTMAAALSGLIASVTLLSKSGGGDMGLIKTAGMIGLLAGSLYILVGAVESFAAIKPEALARGLGGVATALAIVSASLVALTRLGSTGTLSASVALLDVSYALTVLAGAIERFGNMDVGVLEQGIKAVAILVAGFAAFTRLLDPKGLLTASVAIVIMSGSLYILAGGIAEIGNLDWGVLQQGLLGMAVAMLAMVVAANAMSGALAGAAAMLIMSTAIAVLAGALTLLSAISWEGLLIGLAAMAASFLVLGIAGILMAPVVPILIALGAAMLLMGAAAALMGIGLLAAATGLVAIAGASAGVAAAVAIVGTAIIEILPGIGTAIGEAFTNFIVVMGENAPKIIEAFKNILLGMIQAIGELIPEMVLTMMDMLDALLKGIADRLPDLIQSGYDILLAFLQGIADNIQEVVATALEVVAEFINGIAEGLPDLVDSAFNLILTFLEAIEDAIDEYMEKIIAAGVRIGIAIVEGMIQGLWDTIDLLKQAISDLVQEAIDRFKESWGMESPSTVTFDMAKNITLGLVKGFAAYTSTAVRAFQEFGAKVQNGIDPLLASVASNAENVLEINPVINPVLDLTNFNRGARSISGTFGGSSVLARVAYDDANFDQVSTVGSKQPGGASQGGVTFNQYNYSPKSLDRATIYRQTKTQVAKLKLVELGY